MLTKDKIYLYFVNAEIIPRIYQLHRKKLRVNKYWFLYFIGPAQYINGQYFCNLYFILKKKPNDVFIDWSIAVRETVKIDLAMITYFTMGSVFDRFGYLIYRPEHYVPLDGHLNVSISQPLKKKTDGLDFIYHKKRKFPAPPFPERKDFIYYDIVAEKYGKETIVILPVYILCKYLYFKSTYLTQKILDGALLDSVECFHVESDKSGKILFDNSKFAADDIFRIAQYLFMDEESGIKSLQSIESFLRQKLLEESGQGFLDFDFPFRPPFELGLIGKNLIYKKQQYFYAYDIKHLEINGNTGLTVKKITLYPKYEHLIDPQKMFRKASDIGYRFMKAEKQSYLALLENKYSFIRSSFFPPLDFGVEMDCCELVTNYYRKYYAVKSLYYKSKRESRNKTQNFFRMINNLTSSGEFGASFLFLENQVFDATQTKLELFDLTFVVSIVQIVKDKRFSYFISTADKNWFIKDSVNMKALNQLDLKLMITKLIMSFSSEDKHLKSNLLEYEYFYKNFGIIVQEFAFEIPGRWDRNFLEFQTRCFYRQISKFVA